MNALELRFTCRGEGDFALRVDTQLPGSGITAIYGPSGGGKTTLLDCIAGLRATVDGGLIRFDGRTWLDAGRNVPPWQREVGYVFNDARLFPHLSVEGNLRYAGRRRRGGGGTMDADFDGLVRMLELGALLAQMPDTLSAGQRQRAAIARALLGGPRLLLLDEPLANLDAAASRHCLHCLQRLADELALPMLYVSHDIEEVSELADHLLLLEDGSVVEQGPLLDLCGRLDNRLSREESAAAILAASVSGHDEAYSLTALDVEGERLYVNHLPQPPGTRRRVRIPARDVSVCRSRPRDSSILNILPVTVEEIEPGDSPRPMLRLGLGTQHLLARITRKSAAALELRAGDAVYAQIKSAALLMDAADEP